ncbi:MAG: hypothetical protein H7308_20360 [Chthonomonadaceae bacterium]|nr:hypothetical protein [Chthonomonadaceae bacterium]
MDTEKRSNRLLHWLLSAWAGLGVGARSYSYLKFPVVSLCCLSFGMSPGQYALLPTVLDKLALTCHVDAKNQVHLPGKIPLPESFAHASASPKRPYPAWRRLQRDRYSPCGQAPLCRSVSQ